MPLSDVKVLVCGYGSIGKKHALNLQKLGAVVKVWRQRADQAQAVKEDGFDFEPDLQKGLAWCDAAVIATATNAHIAPALAAARARKPFYLEKPVSHDRAGLDELLQAAQGLVVEIGCQMRHHPNLKALHKRVMCAADGSVLAFQAWVGQRLDQWRPGTDYRQGYSADAARGGGALFDLVHEIDLMTWLAGPMQSVSADLRHNSDLEMKAEDLANLILVAEKGAAGVLQLDMLSPAYRRGMQVICTKAVYRWNMKEGILWRDEGSGAQAVDTVPQGYVPSAMLYDCMAYFLKRVDNPSLPASCSLEGGVHDLDILLAARESSETGARRMLKGLSG